MKNYERLYYFLFKYNKEFDLEHIQNYYKITCENFFKKYLISIKGNKKVFQNKTNQINKNYSKIFSENNNRNKGGIFNLIFEKDKIENKIF